MKKVVAPGMSLVVILFSSILLAQEGDGIKWEETLNKAFEKAKNENKPILADFTRKKG